MLGHCHRPFLFTVAKLLPEWRVENHCDLGRSGRCFGGCSVWRQSSKAVRKEFFFFSGVTALP